MAIIVPIIIAAAGAAGGSTVTAAGVAAAATVATALVTVTDALGKLDGAGVVVGVNNYTPWKLDSLDNYPYSPRGKFGPNNSNGPQWYQGEFPSTWPEAPAGPIAPEYAEVFSFAAAGIDSCFGSAAFGIKDGFAVAIACFNLQGTTKVATIPNDYDWVVDNYESLWHDGGAFSSHNNKWSRWWTSGAQLTQTKGPFALDSTTGKRIDANTAAANAKNYNIRSRSVAGHRQVTIDIFADLLP